MKTQTPRIAVYGAGVSGLIAAYYLFKKNLLVDVIDPYGQTTIGSLETEYGVIEKAANSILANSDVIDLLKDIGLEYEYYFDAGKRKYVFSRNKASKWPLTFMETLKNLKKLFSFARKKEHMRPLAYETIGKWGRRVMGETVTQKLICPALQGIYGANSKDVSAKLAFGHLFDQANNKKKSKPKGKKVSGSLSFPKGMQEFQDGLKDFLEKNGVSFVKEKVKDREYSYSVVSTPTHSLPECVSDQNKELLSKIEYKKVSTLTVFVDEKDRMDFSGFGCVFEGEPKGVLGLLLNSDLFDGRAKEGLVSETWILNGEIHTDEEETLVIIGKVRKFVFKRENKVVSSYFKHWEKAFPNYSVELEHVLNELEPQEDVDFFANWTGSLGIGSMIKNGDAFASKVLEKVNG